MRKRKIWNGLLLKTLKSSYKTTLEIKYLLSNNKSKLNNSEFKLNNVCISLISFLKFAFFAQAAGHEQLATRGFEALFHEDEAKSYKA